MRFSHKVVLVLGLAAIGIWMVASIVQEVVLNRSLSQQASQLQAQNSALAATNQGYQRDIAAVKSGAAAEEEARKDGYARSDEHLFIIGTPPPATPAPSRPRVASPSGPMGALQGFWRFLTSRGGS